jgi:DNA end-binding protein Ku
MAKSAWQGYISLGQLGIPVSLFSASKAARSKFVTLHKKDNSPVERITVCRDEKKPIKKTDTVKAVEYEAGKFVTLSEKELERESNDLVKALDIKQFVDPSQVDPIYYHKPYYIVARKGGEHAYALLRQVLSQTRKAAVVQFVLYNIDHLGLLQVHRDLIVLHQLRFANEIVGRNEIKSPALPKPAPAEVEILTSIVDRFTSDFYAEDYHSDQNDRLLDIVERKIRGLKTPKRERLAPHATPEKDIKNTLQQQLDNPPGALPEST